MWIEDNSVTIDMYRDPSTGKVRHTFTVKRNDGNAVIEHIIEVVNAIISTHNDSCQAPHQESPFTMIQT